MIHWSLRIIGLVSTISDAAQCLSVCYERAYMFADWTVYILMDRRARAIVTEPAQLCVCHEIYRVSDKFTDHNLEIFYRNARRIDFNESILTEDPLDKMNDLYLGKCSK